MISLIWLLTVFLNSNQRFNAITTLVIILSYIVAMSVSSLETMLSFVGSTGSTSISFILPGIFGYKLLGSSDIVPILDAKDMMQNSNLSEDEVDMILRTQSARETRLKYFSIALASWGIFVMVVCLTANVWVLVHK